MKKVIYFSFIFICFFICSEFVYAKEYKVKVVDEYVNLRSKASTSGTLIERLELDTIHTLLSVDKTNNWYYVKSASGNTGYISASYAIPFIEGTDSELSTCITELKKAGFNDSSYYPYLCFMKEKFPSWEFVAINTGLDWNHAVTMESACDYSYIATSEPEYIDTTCDNKYTETWYPASKTAVAYYMDPRNFLGENFIFQFEYLSYDDTRADSYEDLMKAIVGNTDFYDYHKTNLLKLMNDAASKHNLSPTFLAARMLQELGSGDSLRGLYSGTEEGYENVYNFINRGVTDSCATTYGAVECGLSKAKDSYGWTSLTKAIEGAVTFLEDGYVSNNQYTIYLQKFNVDQENENELFSHQYQTNIEAPKSEAKIMYGALEDSLDNNFVFYIPVYDDMEKEILNDGSGITPPEGPGEPSSLEIPTIVTNSGYKTSGSTLTNLELEQGVDKLISDLEANANEGYVKVTDKDGKTLTTGTVKTGDMVTITNDKTTTTYTIIIYGDTSGDGKIDAFDLLQVQKQILGTYSLKDEYLSAADTSKDGKVDALDLLQVQKEILNSSKIEQ